MWSEASLLNQFWASLSKKINWQIKYIISFLIRPMIFTGLSDYLFQYRQYKILNMLKAYIHFINIIDFRCQYSLINQLYPLQSWILNWIALHTSKRTLFLFQDEWLLQAVSWLWFSILFIWEEQLSFYFFFKHAMSLRYVF